MMAEALLVLTIAVAVQHLQHFYAVFEPSASAQPVASEPGASPKHKDTFSYESNNGNS